MDFAWAQEYPEVLKICNLFSLTILNKPLRYKYKSLDSFIQDGPQCGLVALAMYVGHPTKDAVEFLVETAKNNGFTNHGEMFSARNMAHLAKSILKDTKTRVFSGNLYCDEIKELLLAGACILIPYDTEKDNSPGLLNGLKAHWAIISGAVETEECFYVLARHGKAKNVAIWKLKDLAESNSQLNEIGSYHKDLNAMFNIPKGGIQGEDGLKNKCVILQ